MSSDPLLGAAASSFDTERSGDLVLVMKPGWSAYDARAAVHWNTATVDDQRVPLLLMGPGVNAGVYRERVTPADIAPTVAALCGITLPRAEGHALRSAMTTPPRR
jgi:arylsulfatase A-like enzyme